MSIAYYNGKFLDTSEVRIPLSDRCIFFGDGIYDAAIGKDGLVYLENEHINRFFKNAARIDIPLPFTKEELSELIRELIYRNNFPQYFIYFQLTRSSAERCHAYPKNEPPNLLMTIKPLILPDEKFKVKLTCTEDLRYSMCDIKTLNLLPAVLASKRAETLGCHESVFIRDGIVTECAHSNIFIVKNGTFYTHPNGQFILPGITRKKVIELCAEMNIPCIEKPFGKQDLFAADEVLITSTSKLCLRASEIDGFSFEHGNNSVADAVISALQIDFCKLKS